MSIYQSPYAAAALGACPCCERLMLPGDPHRGPSRDHIMPREWHSPPRLTLGEGHIRVLCLDCNGLRAMAGHCLGALACARAVAENVGYHNALVRGARLVLRRWRRAARKKG